MRVTKIAILIAAAMALGAPIGAFTTAAAAETQGAKFSDDTYKYLQLFGDAFERVRKDYVEPVSDQELIEAAINGMLTSLDPHSSYMQAKNFQDFQEKDVKGEYGGLGIDVTMEDGFVKVVSPFDDTPAARAGIQPGDLIVAIDGKPVHGLSLSEANAEMRGPVDTPITITIRRPGKDPFDVAMNRAVIKIPSVKSHTDGDVGYIRISQFNEQTQPGLETAIHDIKSKLGDKIKGYVLDLRNNPGGLVDQAISVSDTFLDHGEIVSTRTRRPEETQRFNATPGDMADGKPVVVLINDGTASASEIVAGALQDQKRAIILGTKSFGKGSVQTIIPLGHGETAMRLTTARYYTPSGRSIQALGITPDIEVHPAEVKEIVQNLLSLHEADLKGALRNDTSALLRNDTAASGKPADKDSDRATGDNADYQLARAIDVLEGIALYQRASTATPSAAPPRAKG